MQAQFDHQSVLEFWFKDSGESVETFLKLRDVWFTSSEEFDAAISERFESYIQAAGSGRLDSWLQDSRSLLAFIVVADQFPRNVYRGTSQAFEYDSIALRATELALASGLEQQWNLIERLFAYLPLEHAEDIQAQQRSVELYKKLADESKDTPYGEVMVESYDYAVMHLRIIEQFGRFPHRNAIVQRESTDEEIKFLESGAETFGQVKK